MKKPGRNQPCLCGSGKKFKKCCASITVIHCKDIVTWLQRYDKDPPVDYSTMTVKDFNEPGALEVLLDRQKEVRIERASKYPAPTTTGLIASSVILNTDIQGG